MSTMCARHSPMCVGPVPRNDRRCTNEAHGNVSGRWSRYNSYFLLPRDYAQSHTSKDEPQHTCNNTPSSATHSGTRALLWPAHNALNDEDNADDESLTLLVQREGNERRQQVQRAAGVGCVPPHCALDEQIGHRSARRRDRPRVAITSGALERHAQCDACIAHVRLQMRTMSSLARMLTLGTVHIAIPIRTADHTARHG